MASSRRWVLSRSSFLPFHRPSIDADDEAAVQDVLRSGWLTTGAATKRFESAFKEVVGADAALAVNSGTAALHIALSILDPQPNEAVLTTPLTFCATANVIEHVGARPVFVDVDPVTLNIASDKVVAKVEQLSARGVRTRAILPVHLYGHPCPMDELVDVANNYDLAVIEDAAHALPSAWRGRTTGSPIPDLRQTLFSCFSFYATKNITTGEGGMLTCSAEHLEEARSWSLHGMDRDAWARYEGDGRARYDVVLPGFKYNMSDIQAALGLSQLRRLEKFAKRRRQIANAYSEAFSSVAEVEVPLELADAQHSWHLYVLRLNTEMLTISRDRFLSELARKKIGTSVHFIPLYELGYFRRKYGYSPESFPVTRKESLRICSLPLYPAMSDSDVEDVLNAVVETIGEFRR